MELTEILKSKMTASNLDKTQLAHNIATKSQLHVEPMFWGPATNWDVNCSSIRPATTKIRKEENARRGPPNLDYFYLTVYTKEQ